MYTLRREEMADQLEGDGRLLVSRGTPPKERLLLIPSLSDDPVGEPKGLTSLRTARCENEAVLVVHEGPLLRVEPW